MVGKRLYTFFLGQSYLKGWLKENHNTIWVVQERTNPTLSHSVIKKFLIVLHSLIFIYTEYVYFHMMSNKMRTAALLISNFSVKQWNKEGKVKSISFFKKFYSLWLFSKYISLQKSLTRSSKLKQLLDCTRQFHISPFIARSFHNSLNVSFLYF